MISPRHLLPLTLPLAFAGAVTIAQPAAPDGTEERPETTATEKTAADENQEKAQHSTPARNESPFVYRPSEEISEDLPVSFPVDI